MQKATITIRTFPQARNMFFNKEDWYSFRKTTIKHAEISKRP